MLALAAALLLQAQPFPAPRLAPVSDRLKCDPGTVLAYDAARGELRVTTAAGVVVFKAAGETQVFDAAGQPAGAPSKLPPGQRVRVWYVVEGGARALEIALE